MLHFNSFIQFWTHVNYCCQMKLSFKILSSLILHPRWPPFSKKIKPYEFLYISGEMVWVVYIQNCMFSSMNMMKFYNFADHTILAYIYQKLFLTFLTWNRWNKLNQFWQPIHGSKMATIMQNRNFFKKPKNVML